MNFYVPGKYQHGLNQLNYLQNINGQTTNQGRVQVDMVTYCFLTKIKNCCDVFYENEENAAPKKSFNIKYLKNSDVTKSTFKNHMPYS